MKIRTRRPTDNDQSNLNWRVRHLERRYRLRPRQAALSAEILGIPTRGVK